MRFSFQTCLTTAINLLSILREKSTFCAKVYFAQNVDFSRRILNKFKGKWNYYTIMIIIENNCINDESVSHNVLFSSNCLGCLYK